MTNYDTPERLDAAADKLLGSTDIQDAPGLYFDDLADHAAKLVELAEEEMEQHFPGDAVPHAYYTYLPQDDTVTIDATEYVRCAVREFASEGTHHHAVERGMVWANVSRPEVYVVDADGKPVDNARIMVTYHEIETE